ncbi:M23 family metallopeptidase [Prescottella equi]|uniref:M23 family metallopeptidase n=1 Tax=Rhodococcus hoagii TaxID=43767 RepID=UPI0021D4E43F|nr:M23 family metallopeptidase [Prescottella equi]MCU7531872.1 M23 family metallopeptidase [Prescottella equi]MCU7534004.1 M23 family metallopeptidase [Prescottella equi]
MTRYWPLERGHMITSEFGQRWGTVHWGVDFGWEGGSAGRPVYAVQGGTVWAVGPASGFGQWVVLDHPTEDGSGTTVYGHVIPEVSLGQRVEAGQRIARINPDSNTNGGVAPHLHLEWHRYVWSQPGADRLNPLPLLDGAQYPNEAVAGMDVDGLSRAMGGTVSRERYAALLPAFTAAMREAGCTTVERAAMWCAQLGHESNGLLWMEELASGADYEGRRDLGNTEPGDGRRFKGRGPIQVTGRHNYTECSRWAHGRGLVPTPTYFVDNPAELASDRYGFVGAVWYWTAARPQLNALADARDIVAVTRAINGGTNGLPDRQLRYTRCLALGAALLPEEGFMSALSPEEQRELYEAVCGRRRSLVEGSTAELTMRDCAQLTDAATFRTEREVAGLSDRLDRIERKLEGK